MSKYLPFLIILILNIANPIFAQENFKWVAVKKGEGFNAFLYRNQLTPAKHSAKFKSLNQGRFTKSGHLIAGKNTKYHCDTPPIPFHFLEKSMKV